MNEAHFVLDSHLNSVENEKKKMIFIFMQTPIYLTQRVSI